MISLKKVCIQYFRCDECMHVCTGFIAPIAALVLCARSQDSLLSASVVEVHVVFSTAGFKGGRIKSKNNFTQLLARISI